MRDPSTPRAPDSESRALPRRELPKEDTLGSRTCNARCTREVRNTRPTCSRSCGPQLMRSREQIGDVGHARCGPSLTGVRIRRSRNPEVLANGDAGEGVQRDELLPRVAFPVDWYEITVEVAEPQVRRS